MKKLFCALFVLFCSYAFAQETGTTHHSENHNQVDQRGDHVMGFDHQKTAHHFKLEDNGGTIVAEAKDSADQASIDAIRKHFREIATLFKNGDFSMPERIHGRVPPGVPQMIEHKDHINYEVVETEKGGEVRIRTTNADAIHGIHEFLRFQIQDHRTGDSMTCPHHESESKHAEHGASCPHHPDKKE